MLLPNRIKSLKWFLLSFATSYEELLPYNICGRFAFPMSQHGTHPQLLSRIRTIFSDSSSRSFLLFYTLSSSTSTVWSLGFSLVNSISSVLSSRAFFLFCTLYSLSSYSTTVKSWRFSLAVLSSRSFYTLYFLLIFNYSLIISFLTGCHHFYSFIFQIIPFTLYFIFIFNYSRIFEVLTGCFILQIFHFTLYFILFFNFMLFLGLHYSMM